MKRYKIYILSSLMLILVLNFITMSLAQAEERVVKVGCFGYDGFLKRNVNGIYTGYLGEYLNRIAKITGWQYEYIPGSVAENYERLQNGEIDLLGGIQYSDERAQVYKYSRYSIGEEVAVMYVLPDNDQICYEDFAAFAGLTVGMIKDSYQNVLFAEYAAKHGFSVKQKYYSSSGDLKTALYNHDVDAVVIGSLDGEQPEKLVAQFSPMPFYYITAPENIQLINQLNAALEQIKNDNNSFENNLYEKYYDSLTVQLKFTRADVNFVQQCPVLRIVCDMDSEPLEYFEESSQEYLGSYVDILKLILDRSGIEYVFIPSVSVQDRLNKIQNGDADILLSCYQNMPFAQQYKIRFTEPYFHAKNILVGKKGMSIDDSTQLTVAILAKNIDFEYFIKENYPQWQIKVYNTLEECLDAIENNAVDVSLQNADDFLAFFANNNGGTIQAITTLNAEIPVSLGVAQSLPPQLVNILNKAINSLNKREINQLMINNTIGKAPQLSAWLFIKHKWLEILFASAIGVILLIMLFVQIKRNKEQALAKIVYRDRLTGLRNFEKFELDANALISSCDPAQYAVLYIDIEKFKYINQTLGYERGNAVLLYFTKLFSHQLYADELFARVSGDRFIALLHYENDAVISARIQAFYQSFNCIRSTLLDNQRLAIVSGVYCLTDKDTDIDIAIDRANLARKTAKGSHHSVVVFYDDKIHQQVAKEKEIENIMEKALQEEEFMVYLQPQYDLKSRKIVGAEALARWKNGDGTIIPPSDFIPIFERNGFIIEFDFYVFRQICALQKRWENEGLTVIPIAVNFSRVHVNNPQFIEQLKNIIKEYAVVPQKLEIEMTESAFVENDANAVFLTEQLKKIGFSLSMDDFGTGYSSLNLLREVSFDVLKLDKSFLANNTVSVKEKILISNIIRMAKELQIRVIAEGIETKEQEEFLTGLACDMGQGYYFSRPVPISEFEKIIEKE